MQVRFNKKLSGLRFDETQPYTRGHMSALMKGGNVVAYAESSLAGKSRYCQDAGRSCHSEVAVIKNLNTDKSRKFGKYVVWNVRWSKDGRLVNSKPCLNCQRTLCRVGIRTIVYSTDEGHFVKHRIENITCSRSSGFRY